MGMGMGWGWFSLVFIYFPYYDPNSFSFWKKRIVTLPLYIEYNCLYVILHPDPQYLKLILLNSVETVKSQEIAEGVFFTMMLTKSKRTGDRLRS